MLSERVCKRCKHYSELLPELWDVLRWGDALRKYTSSDTCSAIGNTDVVNFGSVNWECDLYYPDHATRASVFSKSPPNDCPFQLEHLMETQSNVK